VSIYSSIIRLGWHKICREDIIEENVVKMVYKELQKRVLLSLWIPNFKTPQREILIFLDSSVTQVNGGKLYKRELEILSIQVKLVKV